ncbi:MAG: T9SS type A sorting domain-containing protein [Bacteroidales bacterium]|nr:T9SS type A sorting domain-containing protein [Bacteroidales bacterium]
MAGTLFLKPNPATSLVEITFFIQTPGEVKFELFDTFGKPVKVLEFGLLKYGLYQIPVVLDGINPGTYLCRLSSAQFKSVEKLGCTVKKL